MRRSGERLLTLLLLCLAAGLTYALYTEFNAESAATATQPSAEPLAQTQVTTSPTPPVELPPTPPLASFDEITARPLFSPSRRPPPPGEEPLANTPQQASAPPDKSPFSVMGILITDNTRTALLKPLDSGEDAIRASEGELLPGSGWKIVEITPEWVRIEQQGSSETLKLSDNVMSASDKRKLLQQAQKARLQAVQQQQQTKLQAATRPTIGRATNGDRRLRTPPAPPRRIISPTVRQPTVRAQVR
jgi:general secretion pathway protein N